MLATWITIESASFAAMALTLQTPVSALFWYVAPSLDKSTVKTSVYYILPSIVLILIGNVLWKIWEYAEKKRVDAINSIN